VASETRRALVLFSGGQDSTTCLAYALDRYAHVETIGFDYGQRHAVEMESRVHVRARLREQFPRWAKRLGEDHVLDLSVLGRITDTALTSEREIEMNAGGLPNTFVPGRNLLFFTFAAIVADRRKLSVLIGGMCETDFSGYPDCRDNALKSLQVAISLGMDTAMSERLGGEPLIELVAEHTHSCYLGDREHRQAWGYGCGLCPACDLRRKGYDTWLAS
jgi:7-cyano-7-deazaguanine synthase